MQYDAHVGIIVILTRALSLETVTIPEMFASLTRFIVNILDNDITIRQIVTITASYRVSPPQIISKSKPWIFDSTRTHRKFNIDVQHRSAA